MMLESSQSTHPQKQEQEREQQMNSRGTKRKGSISYESQYQYQYESQDRVFSQSSQLSSVEVEVGEASQPNKRVAPSTSTTTSRILPQNILSRIAAFADTSTLRRLSCASKGLNTAALEELWRSATPAQVTALLSPTALPSAAHVGRLLDRTKNVKKLAISNSNAEMAAIARIGTWLLLGGMTNLDQLSLLFTSNSNSTSNSREGDASLLSQLSQTQSPASPSTSAATAFAGFIDTDRLLSLFAGLAPMLPATTRSFSIRGKYINDAQLTSVLTSLKSSIQTLKLTVPSISGNTLSTTIPHLPALHTLTITGAKHSQITPSLLTALSAHPTLKSLSLFPKDGGLTPSSFSSSTTFLNLESLAFDANPSHDWSITLTNLFPQSSPSKLKHLAIAGDAVISPDALNSLSYSLALSLHSLKLHQLHQKIDARSFLTAIQRIRQIQTVEVFFHAKQGKTVKPLMGVALAKGCPNLTHLQLGVHVHGDDIDWGIGQEVMEVYREQKMVAADISHGERLAAQLKEPNPEVPIPNSLTCSALASFSPSEIDLITPVLQLLDIPVNTPDPDTLSCMLKSLKPPLLGSLDPYFSMKFRTTLQQRVAASPSLTAAYIRLIESVIAPHLYNSLTGEEKLMLTSIHPTLPNKRTFQIRYQFPPSLRIHPAGTSKWKRTHRDLEYGHQPGEINFWLPLTPTIDNDAATMHIESTITSDGLSAAYIPIRLH
ncbi:hypothetical protein HDU99_003695, partial [Rhizoclosmatium hyalinum]